MTNLETIAKQVSLLNRLIELLRMQEDFDDPKWSDYFPGGVQRTGKYITFNGRSIFSNAIEIPADYIPNARLTQKAWSDELVKVAKELKNLKGIHEPIIAAVLFSLNLKAGSSWESTLEAILNKYDRSLTE